MRVHLPGVQGHTSQVAGHLTFMSGAQPGEAPAAAAINLKENT